MAVFTLETDNPSKTGYPSSTDNPSLCENGTVFILDPSIFIRPIIRQILSPLLMLSASTGTLFSTRSQVTSPYSTPLSVDTDSTACP